MNKLVITNKVFSLLRPAVWSNIIFLVPFVFAIRFENISLALVVILVFVISVTFHFVSENKSSVLLTIDRVFGGILTLFNAGLVAFGGFTPPYVYWVLLLVVVAMYFFRKSHNAWLSSDMKKYEVYHSLWHVATAFVTIFSILTFYTV